MPYYASLPKSIEKVVEKSDIKLLFAGKLDEWGNKGETLNDKLKVIKFPHYMKEMQRLVLERNGPN